MHGLELCILAHRFKKLTVAGDSILALSFEKLRLSRVAISDLESQVLVEGCRSASSSTGFVSLLIDCFRIGIGDDESVPRIAASSVENAMRSAGATDRYAAWIDPAHHISHGPRAALRRRSPAVVREIRPAFNVGYRPI